MLRAQRSSPSDLEFGGELVGLPPGSTRFIRYEDLLGLKQETWTVNDDVNVPRGTEIAGVPLTALVKLFARDPALTLVVAICDDKYRASYPRDYLAAHHPLLVLRMNGKPHDLWPQSNEGGPLAPYFISHPSFKPAFKVLSHEDEQQIPYGVVRIEFRNEPAVLGAIRPRGNLAAASKVMQGYIIARQDCFRCHNMGAEGGTKAGRTWLQLAADASKDGARFKQSIRNPASVTPNAKMPPHANYDDATLAALLAYFRAFAQSHPEKKPNP